MKYAQMQTDAVSHLETFAKNMRLYIYKYEATKIPSEHRQ